MRLPAKGNNGGDCVGSVGSVLGVYVTNPSNEVCSVALEKDRKRWNKRRRHGELTLIMMYEEVDEDMI